MRLTLLAAWLGISGAVALPFALAVQAGAWRDLSPHQVRRLTVDSSVQLETLEWRGPAGHSSC
jgi:hypothetical protein